MIAAAPVLPEPRKMLPLPPSGRDFEVYRRLAVEGRTTREVSAEFEISQTRVMQLRAKVLEWIGTHAPLLGRLSPADRLRVAETLACEQLQYQYDEAMEAWRKSATAQHVTRYVGRAIEDGMTVVKESYGDPRYLRLATQISKAIAKLGMATVPDPETAVPVAGLADLLMSGISGRESEAEDAAHSSRGDQEPRDDRAHELRDADLSHSPETQFAADVANHPVGDCSEQAVASTAAQATGFEQGNETLATTGSCQTKAARNSNAGARETLENGTVQAVLEHLENVPRKIRKQLRREQQMRQELFGGATGSPLASLGMGAWPG